MSELRLCRAHVVGQTLSWRWRTGADVYPTAFAPDQLLHSPSTAPVSSKTSITASTR